MTTRSPAERIIVALDVEDRNECFQLVDALQPALKIVKVGPVLFGVEGPQIIRDLNEKGLKVFLDLKLHDIPNTVASTIYNMCRSSSVSMLTVHTSGGEGMLSAARKSVNRLPEGTRPLLLGVTILTSLSPDELDTVGFRPGALSGHVQRLGSMAVSSGIDGLVCSAHEVKRIRELVGKKIRLVVPGIRPAGTEGTDDQKRTATPGDAVRSGADYLVIGRPISAAAAPGEAFQNICSEIATA